MNIRILSYNIHKAVGWGIIKSSLSQIHSQLCQIDHDIIFLQEVRGAQFESLTAGIWPHFSYGKNAVYQKGHHGNVILSKFPISHAKNIDLTVRNFEKRGMLHSIVKLSQEIPHLHLLCVHLGLFTGDRKKQLKYIVDFIKTEIPENEPIILGGDFNDWSNLAGSHLIQALGLKEAFMTTSGICARTFPAWAPILRLDRIYFRELSVVNTNRFIHKPWRYLSDHIAIEATLKISTRK